MNSSWLLQVRTLKTTYIWCLTVNTSGLFWEKMPMYWSGAVLKPFWISAEPMYSDLSATWNREGHHQEPCQAQPREQGSVECRPAGSTTLGSKRAAWGRRAGANGAPLALHLCNTRGWLHRISLLGAVVTGLLLQSRGIDSNAAGQRSRDTWASYTHFYFIL